MRTPKSRPSVAIPTNGHPTRKAAIIDLYERKVQQKVIAQQLGCSRNAVSSTIHDYRQKTGRFIEPEHIAPPKMRLDTFADSAETQRGYRLLNYRKSIKGAREALLAMGAHP